MGLDPKMSHFKQFMMDAENWMQEVLQTGYTDALAMLSGCDVHPEDSVHTHCC